MELTRLDAAHVPRRCRSQLDTVKDAGDARDYGGSGSVRETATRVPAGRARAFSRLPGGRGSSGRPPQMDMDNAATDEDAGATGSARQHDVVQIEVRGRQPAGPTAPSPPAARSCRHADAADAPSTINQIQKQRPAERPETDDLGVNGQPADRTDNANADPHYTPTVPWQGAGRDERDGLGHAGSAWS